MVIKVCLMRGEFDDNPYWPFLAQIDLKLQCGNNSYFRSVVFLGGPESKRVTTGERSECYCGLADFITFEELELCFVENGCFHIRISEVKLHVGI